MNDKPFVLALTGPPGAGKTTLTSLLQCRHAGARVLSFDTYRPLTGLSQTQIREWFANGSDLDAVDHSEIIAALRRETARAPGGPRRRPLLLFETPFGRWDRQTGAFIDFLVWVDTPLDIALARAILASMQRALREPTPREALGFLDWQKQYLMFYPVLRSMYLVQREKVAPGADLAVDGTRPVETCAETIERTLRARGL